MVSGYFAVTKLEVKCENKNKLILRTDYSQNHNLRGNRGSISTPSVFYASPLLLPIFIGMPLLGSKSGIIP